MRANCVQMKKGFKAYRLKPFTVLWEHTGSNRGPSACKADALNQLSYAPFLFWDGKDKGKMFSTKFFQKLIQLHSR